MPVQTRSRHIGDTPKFAKPPSPRRRKKSKEERVSGEHGHEETHHEESHPEGNEAVKTQEEHKQVGEKREHDGPSEPQSSEETDQLPEKKKKTEEADVSKYQFYPGIIERGHIYFFYRPKVQHEEVHSLDDVKNLHLLLVPRPPEFSVAGGHQAQASGEGHEEMTLLAEGADVAPAPETLDQPKKRYRLLTVGKKHLPEIEGVHHDALWATITAVGDDLHSLERGLGEKTYETKTQGVRHEGQARLAGRGVYNIVNTKGYVPSRDVTHLAYHLTHPSKAGEVQQGLGIHVASSFVVQVKNPLADAPSYGQRVGLPAERRAHYPDVILDNVFERGSRGRHPFGLRFTTCHCIELLDYEGTELLLIASGTGVARSDETLGEHRGEALRVVSEQESQEPIEDVFRELAADKEAFPAEPLEGHWI